MSVELMCKCIADNGLTSFKMYYCTLLELTEQNKYSQ